MNIREAINRDDAEAFKLLLNKSSKIWQLSSVYTPSLVHSLGYYTLKDLLQSIISKERIKCLRVFLDAGADPCDALIFAATFAKSPMAVEAILESPAAAKIPLCILKGIVSEDRNTPVIFGLINQYLEKNFFSQKIQERISDIPSITMYLNEHKNDELKIIDVLKKWAQRIQDESVSNNNTIDCTITTKELKMLDNVDLHLGKTQEGSYVVSVYDSTVLFNIIKVNLTRNTMDTIKGPFLSDLVAVDREICLEDLIQKYHKISAAPQISGLPQIIAPPQISAPPPTRSCRSCRKIF